MSDSQSTEDMKKCTDELQQTEYKMKETPPATECSGNVCSGAETQATTTTINVNDKSIQIDMDCEPGEDPKKNKKYWQDTAGLRGAREQYLQLDIRDLCAAQSRQNDYIQYLKAKLERALKEIEDLKAKRCRCDEEEELEIFQNKQFSSMGL